MKRKPGRPRKATRDPKFYISANQRTYEQLERIAEAHGVTSLDKAIVIALDGCADCVAEKARI